jgi:23S rRNA (adenine2030-N6)-methyltransferase
MLSYRHAFHAGNFADVFKHVVLTRLLLYLVGKDRPLCYIDTHAGGGAYDLQSAHARKTAESELGIGRLWQRDDLPGPVASYVELVRRFVPEGRLTRYPGSPWFAAALLRPHDRLVLCERHGSDFPILGKTFAGDRRVHCYKEDGYRLSVGLVPPRERRGLVLIDPSYEQRDEYRRATDTLRELHRRFATGVYALWYPLIGRHRPDTFRRLLDATDIRDLLKLELIVAAGASRPNLHGCGLIVVNAPWTLEGDMRLALPYLAARLAQHGAGDFRIERRAGD